MVCPSDPQGGQVPGLTDFGTNYVACNGTGVAVDSAGAITAYLKIGDGNGVYAQNPVKIADVTDGTSNTAAFSESTLGTGQVPADPTADPKRVVLEVPGGNDTTVAACEGPRGRSSPTGAGSGSTGTTGTRSTTTSTPRTRSESGTAGAAATTRADGGPEATTRAGERPARGRLGPVRRDGITRPRGAIGTRERGEVIVE